VLPDEGVVIRCNSTLVTGVFGVGGEAFGEVAVAVDSPDDEIHANDVTGDLAGKVVVAGSTAGPEALRALAGAGVKAVIVGYMPVLTLQEFCPGLNMGITGKEDVPFTLVITEGFLPSPMSRDVFSALSRYAGKVASCNGTTHIRAGVIRPEVIMPEGTSESAEAIESSAGGQALFVGARVRLLRRPYLGLSGTITGVDKEKTALESGITALTYRVRLDDGRNIKVPRSNCTRE
jgi:hypothetical protein